MNLFKEEEIRRLWGRGLALHWLKPRSKMPVHAGWTKGPRLPLDALLKDYRPNYNLGVRLGHASKIGKSYLAVIDLDVKSDKPEDAKEAEAKLFQLFPAAKNAPKVASGRGNGSAHYYVLLAQPVSGSDRKAQSTKEVKVLMPSVPPSRKERNQLDEWDLIEGWRLRAAWEISLLSEGRQVVLPGSVHPDTGRAYAWVKPWNQDSPPPVVEPIQQVESKGALRPSSASSLKTKPLYNFTTVDAETLGLRQDQLAALREGEGVEDRSAALFSLSMALFKRGVSEEKIISLLTDKQYVLGHVAYEHAGQTSDRQVAARWLVKYTLRKAKEKVQESSFDFAPVEVGAGKAPAQKGEKKDKAVAGGPPVVMIGSRGLELTEEWHKELDLQRSASGAPPVIKATAKNVRLILTNTVDDSLIKRNVFALEDHYDVDCPWGFDKGHKRSAGMEDAIQIKHWFINEWGVEPSVNVIDETLTSIALDNAYHPVKEMLEALPAWDGVERVETAFKKYVRADMPEPYLSEVSRKFFLAMLARIYEPGVKFDHVVVFEGKQGIGKSTFGPLLIGKEWFIDSLGDLGDKDAALNLQGMWLVEMGELASVYRSQMEVTKSFVTRSTDKVRPPYGHRRVEMPRTCVFYGTTNHSDYLIDSTGNRRYWPVWVNGLDFAGLRRDRLQLLAEAKFLYENFMEPLYLEGKAKAQAEQIQALRLVDDESDSMVNAFLKWLGKSDKVDGLVLVDLFRGSGPFIEYQMNHANQLRAAKAMRLAGYEKVLTRHGKRWNRIDF